MWIERGLMDRVLLGAVAALSLIAAPACTERSCVDIGCAPRTEIYFEEPIREAGDYVIEGTGTGGVPIECRFSVASASSGGILVDDSGCGGFLPFEWPDAGNRPQLDGLIVGAHISSALLTVRRDGVTLYDGQATLETTRVHQAGCGPSDCDTPVLIAR